MTLAIGIYITRTGWPAANPSDLKDATNRATAAAAKAWHHDVLPEHFRPAAARKYSYQARNAVYMRRKAKEQGHQNPLMWTGELRDSMRRSFQLTRTTGGVTLKMYGRALNFSGKVARRAAGEKFFGESRYPNMKREVTQTIQAEETQLARVARKSATASLREIRAVKRKRV